MTVLFLVIMYRLADYSKCMEHVVLYMSNHSVCAVSCVQFLVCSAVTVSMSLGRRMHAAIGTGE